MGGNPLEKVADDQIQRMLEAWPAHRSTPGWRDEMRRSLVAAADEPSDIKRAVTKAIQTTISRFPPDIASMTQGVAQQRIARVETAREAEQEARRRAKPQPAEPWRGWLAIAAHHAYLIDRGHTRPTKQAIQPYLDLVLDLGYRNHHGCGDYRDVDGHLHPADPLYDARLSATAVAGAERIWREQGMPGAPSLAPSPRRVEAA